MELFNDCFCKIILQVDMLNVELVVECSVVQKSDNVCQ